MTYPAQIEKQRKVRDWLVGLLGDGPLPVSEIHSCARAVGITPKQLRYAREAVCGKPLQHDHGWWWHLRASETEPSDEAHRVGAYLAVHSPPGHGYKTSFAWAVLVEAVWKAEQALAEADVRAAAVPRGR